jgi:xanthosine utilization system XapX-like protein
MTLRVVALGVGLVLGIVWAWLGFGAALLSGALALVGWFVGSLIEGTIQFTDVWSAIQGRRRSLD